MITDARITPYLFLRFSDSVIPDYTPNFKMFFNSVDTLQLCSSTPCHVCLWLRIVWLLYEEFEFMGRSQVSVFPVVKNTLTP